MANEFSALPSTQVCMENNLFVPWERRRRGRIQIKLESSIDPIGESVSNIRMQSVRHVDGDFL